MNRIARYFLLDDLAQADDLPAFGRRQRGQAWEDKGEDKGVRKTKGSGLIIWLARSFAGAEGALQPQRGDSLRFSARAAVEAAAMDAAPEGHQFHVGLRLGYL